MTGNITAAEAEVWANDPEDTEILYAELGGAPGIKATAVSLPVQPGEQGAALDLLIVGLSSGAVTAFLQIIKTLAEARGPKFVLSIRRGKNQLKITADNVEEAETAIRALFGGQQTPGN
jgi:hypothetical protein